MPPEASRGNSVRDQDWQQQAKRRAALRAADLIEDGMLVGLGTGTTAALFIEALGSRVAQGLRITGAPTSSASEAMARAHHIPLVNLASAPTIDIDVDGADEIDPQLNLLKGGGGALLYEKLVAISSRRVMIIADETKLVEELGRGPIPVEIVAFYSGATICRLQELGGEPELRMTNGSAFVTDSGNNIVDVRLPEGLDVFAFGGQLKHVPGVIEHGIFEGLVERALIGDEEDGVREITRHPQTAG